MPGANRTFLKPTSIPWLIGPHGRLKSQGQTFRLNSADTDMGVRSALNSEGADRDRQQLHKEPTMEVMTNIHGTTFHESSTEEPSRVSNRNSMLKQKSIYYGEKEIAKDLRLLDKITWRETQKNFEIDSGNSVRHVHSGETL